MSHDILPHHQLKWLTVKTVCIKNKSETKFYYILFEHVAAVHNSDYNKEMGEILKGIMELKHFGNKRGK